MRESRPLPPTPYPPHAAVHPFILRQAQDERMDGYPTVIPASFGKLRTESRTPVGPGAAIGRGVDSRFRGNDGGRGGNDGGNCGRTPDSGASLKKPPFRKRGVGGISPCPASRNRGFDAETQRNAKRPPGVAGRWRQPLKSPPFAKGGLGGLTLN